MPFYDLSEAERIALTERAMAMNCTVIDRWAALGDNEAEPWSARSARAAELLSLESGVLDLGCGTMLLERYLASGIQYWPCDVQKRDHRTIVCDLNIDLPPTVCASAVACLGVLEYIYNPAGLVEALARSYKIAVISYCITDAPQAINPRRAHAWVNDFSRSDIESIFDNSGWDVDFFEQRSEIEAIWRLVNRCKI